MLRAAVKIREIIYKNLFVAVLEAGPIYEGQVTRPAAAERKLTANMRLK